MPWETTYQQRYPQKLGRSGQAGALGELGITLVWCWIVLVVSGCTITAYRGIPAIDPTKPPILPQNVVLYYRVEPAIYWRDALFAAQADFFAGHPAKLEDYQALDRAFVESGTFSAVIQRLTPPEKGLYCLVQVTYEPLDKVDARLLSLAHATAALVPAYHDSSGHLVRYHLYVDRDLKKTYEYRIRTIRAAWVGLAPLFWTDALSPGLKRAFHATTYQFFVDAAVDGFFRTSEG